jgi:small-conductance mechanosensitive channel
MILLNWYSVTLDSLINLWRGFLGFIPQVVGAVIVFVIGWFVAEAVGKVVADILKRVQFNQLFAGTGWKDALAKAEIKVNPAEFIGGLFKWTLLIVFLLAAVEILGLSQFAAFLTNVLAYLPNVLVASFIFVVAVIISELLEKILRATVEGAGMGYGHFVGVIVKWSIWIFAIIAILLQLGVTPFLLQTLFTGVVAFLVVAGGLAFGLGGKEVAGEFLQDLKKKLKG